MWGHDQGIIRMEQDCALEDHSSSKMHKVTGRTDQLLHIAGATNSKVYTQESEAEAHGWMKALVLSLKQHHAHYYWLYERGTTMAMVGLQGMHLGDAFRHSNISSSVGLKSFWPWCFKPGGNTEMIATHIREVHYRLAIICNLCKLFVSMSTQSSLDLCSGCETKCTKECTKEAGHENVKKLHKKNPSHENRKKYPNC